MPHAYQLKRLKRSRSLRVRVEPSGKLLVTAPPYVPLIMVETFIERSMPWINRQREKLELAQSSFPIIDREKGIVNYLGTLLTLKHELLGERVRLHENTLLVNPATGLVHDMWPTVYQWLKRQGETVLSKRAEYWSEKMRLSYKLLKFRQQRSRWGSCSSNGTLSFNWRLVHFNVSIIDYVVIHELAHIRHHNHSSRFWGLVEQYKPDYKQHRLYLKKQVVDLI